MKKVLVFLTVLTVMFVGSLNVYAEEVTLKDASISATDVDVSSGAKEVTIEFTTDVALDVDKDYNVGLNWRADSCLYYSYDPDKVDAKDEPCLPKRAMDLYVMELKKVSDLKYSVTFEITNETMPGKWTLLSLYLDDGTDYYEFSYFTYNDSIYKWEANANADIFDKIAINLTNNNYVDDTLAPNLDKVTIKNSDYSVPGKLEVELELSDDLSSYVYYQLEYRTVALGDNGNYSTRYFEGNLNFEGGKQSGKVALTMPIENKYQKLYLWYISLEDDAGNRVYYTNDVDALANYGMSYHEKKELDVNLDLIPSDYVEDNVGPTLKSYKYEKNEVVVSTNPGYNNTSITFDITDDGIGLIEENNYRSIGDIVLKNENNEIKYGYIYYDASSKSFISDLRFDLNEAGEWYVSEVTIYDLANNESVYSIEKGNLTKQVFTVKENKASYTLETNVTEDYVSKVADLAEGSTVYIDIEDSQVIKKELFETIKGKDITVTFGYYDANYSRYVEYVISGKDVTSASEDIDLSIKFDNYTYKYMLNDYEFPSFKLDSSIPYEEALEKLNNEKKAAIEKYFDVLVGLGFKEAKEMKKEALELFDEFVKDFGEGLPIGLPISEAIMSESELILSWTFADNKTMPGKMKVRIYDSEYANQEGSAAQYLFNIKNDNSKYSLTRVAENIKLTKDSFYEFNYPGAGTFWLMNDDLRETNDKLNNPPTGDNVVTSIFVMVTSALCLLSAGIYLKKTH